MQNCFICHNTFEKGISICCSRQCHNIRINSLRDYTSTQLIVDKNSRIANYEQNPKRCVSCNTPFPYMKRKLKFCNNSCSAQYNNRTRQLTKPMKVEPKVKLVSKVAFAKCKNCQAVFRRRIGRLYCSDSCKAKSGIKVYRLACKFKLNKLDHAHLYDQELLQTFGWYRAANHPLGYNPKGATWDHLFRVEDGFKLGISPSIMSHPANAQMVSWVVNFSRKTSQITYEQLLDRITNYDK